MVSVASRTLDKSSASASSLAEGMPARMDAMASATRASVRPLTTTRAPSAARALAMAKPMPAVEPVTRASLFSSWRFMVFFYWRCGLQVAEQVGFCQIKNFRAATVQHCLDHVKAEAHHLIYFNRRRH